MIQQPIKDMGGIPYGGADEFAVEWGLALMLKHFVLLTTLAAVPAAVGHAATIASLYTEGNFFYVDAGGFRDVNLQQSQTTPVAEVSSEATLTNSEGGQFFGSYFAQARFGQVRIRTVANGITNRGGANAAAFADDYITVFGAPAGSILKSSTALHGTGNDGGNANTTYLLANSMGFAVDLGQWEWRMCCSHWPAERHG